MSQPTTESANQLNEVINRINSLTKPAASKPVLSEPSNIPKLTEPYVGDSSLEFAKAIESVLPRLQEPVNQQPFNTQLTATQKEQLLNELQPLIKAAVKKAILQEIVVMEKALKTTLEQDIMNTLRQRIESGQY